MNREIAKEDHIGYYSSVQEVVQQLVEWQYWLLLARQQARTRWLSDALTLLLRRSALRYLWPPLVDQRKYRARLYGFRRDQNKADQQRFEDVDREVLQFREADTVLVERSV